MRSAASNASGSFFPRFSARRRIPAQAFALKKNRSGRSPVSKISDKEHTAAALGHSVVLSVQHSPAAAIPEFCQRPDDGSEIPSAARGQHSGHVLPDDPAGATSASQTAKLKGQVAAFVVQTSSEAGDGEGLAGGSPHEKVDSR